MAFTAKETELIEKLKDDVINYKVADAKTHAQEAVDAKVDIVNSVAEITAISPVTVAILIGL